MNTYTTSAFFSFPPGKKENQKQIFFFIFFLFGAEENGTILTRAHV